MGGPGAVLLVYLVAELLLFTQFIPYVLLARTNGRWLWPMLPALRFSLAITWPLRAVLGLAISVAHISDEEVSPRPETPQEGIEALVEESAAGGHPGQP